MQKLSQKEMDLYLAFAIRERRLLRSRETSFTQIQLRDAEKSLQKLVKSVREKKKLAELLAKGKLAKLGTELGKQNKRFSRKQIALVLDNFPVFELSAGKVEEKKSEIDYTKSDKYYTPKVHRHREKKEEY
jgi:hypothetical protein